MSCFALVWVASRNWFRFGFRGLVLVLFVFGFEIGFVAVAVLWLVCFACLFFWGLVCYTGTSFGFVLLWGCFCIALLGFT